jgi:hypothetical protein
MSFLYSVIFKKEKRKKKKEKKVSLSFSFLTPHLKTIRGKCEMSTALQLQTTRN